jgi:hypothetical protein
MKPTRLAQRHSADAVKVAAVNKWHAAKCEDRNPRAWLLKLLDDEQTAVQVQRNETKLRRAVMQ